jgi:hypothetical protein
MGGFGKWIKREDVASDMAFSAVFPAPGTARSAVGGAVKR